MSSSSFTNRIHVLIFYPINLNWQHLLATIQSYIMLRILLQTFSIFLYKRKLRFGMSVLPASQIRAFSVYIYFFIYYCSVTSGSSGTSLDASTVNQNSTPSLIFRTPYPCPRRSMVAFTMERPTPLPPYSLVRALSTL